MQTMCVTVTETAPAPEPAPAPAPAPADEGDKKDKKGDDKKKDTRLNDATVPRLAGASTGSPVLLGGVAAISATAALAVLWRRRSAPEGADDGLSTDVGSGVE